MADGISDAERGIDSRGVPAKEPETAVVYRIENEIRPVNPKARTFYPFWISVPQGKDEPPNRMELSPGVVAYRVNTGASEAEKPLTPPPLVSAPPPLPPPPPVRRDRSAEPPLSPPPLVQAAPIQCPPGYMPSPLGGRCIPTPELERKREEDQRRQERLEWIRDYGDATFDQGFGDAAKVAKFASGIPGAGPGFKAAEAVLDAVHTAWVGARLVEELVAELDQPDALAKGSKELIGKAEDVIEKRADKALDKILRRRGIGLPESGRKFIIKQARDLIDKKLRDPAIEKGKEEFKQQMDPTERGRTLWQEWSRGIPPR